jgi:hypothetical protein
MEDDDICRSIVILLEFNRKVCFSILVCVVHFFCSRSIFVLCSRGEFSPWFWFLLPPARPRLQIHFSCPARPSGFRSHDRILTPLDFPARVYRLGVAVRKWEFLRVVVCSREICASWALSPISRGLCCASWALDTDFIFHARSSRSMSLASPCRSFLFCCPRSERRPIRFPCADFFCPCGSSMVLPAGYSRTYQS